MKKKNGFIAISIIYSFFLCFIMLMMGMLANYAHTKLIVSKINEPLIFNKETVKPDNPGESTTPEEPQPPELTAPKNKDDCEKEGMNIYLYCKIFANNNILTSKPDFSKPASVSNTDKCNNGCGLFSTDDNEGTSYYFRGDVDNNNVIFADKNWKILRINGDGTIRLILSDAVRNYSGTISTEFNNAVVYQPDGTVGYTYNNAHDCTQANPCPSDYQNGSYTATYKGSSTKDSTIKTALETWYTEIIANNSKYKDLNSQVALTTFCNDTSASGYTDQSGVNYEYYGAYTRIQSKRAPSLICPNPKDNDGGVYKLKVGLPTVDEMVFSGLTSVSSASDTTKMNKSDGYFLKDTFNINLGGFWTMSNSYSLYASAEAFNFIYTVNTDGYISDYYSYYSSNVYPSDFVEHFAVPVINLKMDTIITDANSKGEKNDPYEVKSDLR